MTFTKWLLGCVAVLMLIMGGPGYGLAQDASSDSDADALLDELTEDDAGQSDADDLLDELGDDTDAAGGDETDLLDELEGDDAEPEKEAGVFKQFYDNVGGSFRGRYMFYTKGAPENKDQDQQEHLVEYLLKFNSHTGGEIWRFDVAGWAEGGNQRYTYAGGPHWMQDPHRNLRRHLEINELYLTLYSENFDTVVGKKVFKNTVSTLFSPADRLRPQDLHDPFDPKDIALWQAKIDYYWKGYTITGAIFPIYQGEKLPQPSNRWTGAGSSFDTESDEELEEEYPEVGTETFGYFGRVKTTLSGWDLFFSYYHGPSSTSVLREEAEVVGGVNVTTLIKTTPFANTIGFGFSTTYKKWEFHGEAIWNQTEDGEDDNYWNYVGGFTYTFDTWPEKIGLEKVDVTMEFSRETITDTQDAEGYTQSSEENRLGRYDIYTRITFQRNDDLKFRYANNFEFVDEGHYHRLEADYDFKPGWNLNLAYELFGGEQDQGYYGRWLQNDRIVTMLKYSF